MQSLILLLFTVIPNDVVIKQTVDRIELNHYYDENGKVVFNQLIFYEWNHDRFDVLEYRILKFDDLSAGIKNFKLLPNGIIFFDGGTMKCIKTSNFIETHTQYDVEQEERLKLPKEQRKGLRPSKNDLLRHRDMWLTRPDRSDSIPGE